MENDKIEKLYSGFGEIRPQALHYKLNDVIDYINKDNQINKGGSIEDKIRKYIKKISSMDEICEELIYKTNKDKADKENKRKMFSIDAMNPIRGIRIIGMQNCEWSEDKNNILIVDMSLPAMCSCHYYGGKLGIIYKNGKITLENIY